ncbi:hypothetical protein Pcinc_023954 [Petrolisthes cinctipes]|uniref:SH2 domain-containing protein n=1 Tax=Petrolisthes cinctipes TaxID=88211 RepID=A0AAE1FD39_PETCI|nr:hypothetical protein Pcinc_023954 [Petrolisthes cinctipes]
MCVGVTGVSHTLGPLDGSLYATVTKKRHQPLPASPHSPLSPHALGPAHTHSPHASAHTPSPHGLVNGRYAASIDSGIASSNSAGAAPVSPPTSDTSQASGDSRGTAAAVAPGRAGSGVAGVSAPAAPPVVDARQLDELLQGMLLDIQSIPDLRPSLTTAPDIDSIKCPDFTTPCPPPPRMETRRDVGDGAPLHSPVNGYSGSTTQDSLLDTSMSTTDDVPYHARTDSKPFSYGAITSSPRLGRRRTSSEGGEGQAPPSPSIHRRDSRETLHQHRAGLESPRLVRRMSGSVGGTPGDTTGRRSPSPSPSPEPGSRSGSLHRQRSQTMTTRLMSTGDTPTSTLTRSHHARSASTLDHAFDSTLDSHSRSFSSTGSNNLSWLQMQQRKLAERREAKFRAERAPQEDRMLAELRSRMTQNRSASSKDFEDGYVSDTTLFSETSRESSPVKTMAPLTINTGAPSHSTPQKPPIGQSAPPGRGNSAPSSPVPPNRNHSSMSGQRSLPRKHSDASDRERPFMAVKRAHDNSRTSDTVDSSAALSQLQTSPHGHINYSSYSSASATEGLLTTVASSSQERQDSLDALTATLASLGNPSHHPPSTTTTSSQPHPSTTTTITTTIAGNNASATSHSVQSAQTSQSRDDSAWQSDNESSISGNRPITPGFPPATPTTPYLNQGLPPKSPTMQRREMGGVRSPSPATSQQLAGRQEVNGHSSPAPSLYHGQSRRSSLTSLSEAAEVISSHPKFVKDISKFWYKPTITRDEAISMLREKTPGTFVVRDSNSFPGAFGLALKVSTPPPNVASKSTSDPASELVRHFLIEPTSRGVRLKGCPNEPVFGSLSALVYQHSITPLALPCRLVLPDRDPAGVTEAPEAAPSSGNTTQLLQQGAACNVMYLHTTDTESLTGPQAVKRAVSLTLATKTTPTVVHFKVSAQGITLTDNERKLFFRRHYPVNTISHCGLDPDDRRWTHKAEDGSPLGSLRIFGFVAKKGSSRTENQCHILAELEPEQPATAICNFVTKVMMTSVSRPNLV